MCLSSTNDLVKVGKKWKMINNPGHPLTLKTDQKIQKISEIVCKVRRLSVRMIADMVGINRETVRTNLAEEAAESLEEQSLDAASGQCPSSQRPFALVQ